MDPHEALREHTAWAEAALEMVSSRTTAQQHNFLTHIYRTAAHVRATGDQDAAVRLCLDIAASVELRDEGAIRATLDTSRRPNRLDSVPLEKALESLSSAVRP